MSAVAKAYTVLWVIACFVALVCYLMDRKSFALSHGKYWGFLFRPWKILTFVAALVGLIIVASLSATPDLDYYNAVFMAILTFLFAPWVIGVLYKTGKGEASVAQAYVALCLWLFCASWSFDLYMLIKKGGYSIFWPTYMLGTLGLYMLGGLFWNLDWKEGRGTIFAFMKSPWPEPTAATVFHKIIGLAILFMLVVSGLFLWFFWTDLFGS